MDELTYFFIELITQHRQIDIAEAEFRRLMEDDEELRVDYRTWCEENGYSEKRGFSEFCEEYLDSQDSKWETLNDYDE